MVDEEKELLGIGELLNPGVKTLIYATDPSRYKYRQQEEISKCASVTE